jgi:ABC-type uncharacterized transport system permease subunit
MCYAVKIGQETFISVKESLVSAIPGEFANLLRCKRALTGDFDSTVCSLLLTYFTSRLQHQDSHKPIVQWTIT